MLLQQYASPLDCLCVVLFIPPPTLCACAVLVSNMPNVCDRSSFSAAACPPSKSSEAGVPPPPRTADVPPHGPKLAVPRVTPKDERVLGQSVNPSDPWVDVKFISNKTSKAYAVRVPTGGAHFWRFAELPAPFFLPQTILPKRAKRKTLETLADAAEADTEHHHAYIVDIRCSTKNLAPGTSRSAGFAISVDGHMHGSFARIRYAHL